MRHSSITSRRPASPKRRSFIIASTAACPSSTLFATITPLPSARPSALITMGKRDSRRKRGRSFLFLEDRRARRRNALCRINSLAKIFDDSSRAADFVGPNTRKPFAFEKIDDPRGQRIIRTDHRKTDAVIFRETAPAPADRSPGSRRSRRSPRCPRCPARKKCDRRRTIVSISRPARVRGRRCQRRGFSRERHWPMWRRSRVKPTSLRLSPCVRNV